MADKETDYTEAPTSRLGANTLAASRAMDAKRRATSAQRQGMGFERTMQRRYRQAVRNKDIQAASFYGSQLGDMGVSKSGGAGIQSTEENNFQAARRAERAREIGNQVGQETDRLTGKNQPSGTVDTKASPASSGTPDGEAEITRLTADAVEQSSGGASLAEDVKKFGGSFISPRNQFIADLKKSKLIKDEDPNAINVAAERGAKFGITKDQIEAFSQGLDANKSAIKTRAKDNKDITLAYEALDKEKTSNESRQVNEKTVSDFKAIFDSIPANPLYDDPAYAGTIRSQRNEKIQTAGKQAEEAESNRDNKLAEISKEKNNILLQNQNRANQGISERFKIQKSFSDYEYWTASDDEVLSKTKRSSQSELQALDTSDPRFPAYNLRKNILNEKDFSKIKVFNSGQGRNLGINQEETNKARKNAFQYEMINRAISENIDISGFASIDPDFKIKYDAALKDEREIADDELAVRSYKFD